MPTPKHSWKLTTEQWAEARRLWERGESGRVIGEAFGVSNQAVFSYAQAHGWPKRRTVTVLAPSEAAD